MHAGRGNPDKHVSFGDFRTVDELILLHGADSESRYVIVFGGIHAGHLGGFTAHEGAARLTAAFGHARHYRLHHFRTVLADRHIIKEEKRLGALGKDIVDAHGHRVYAYRVVLVEKKGDFKLCAHTVRAAHQYRMTVAETPEIEHSSECADSSHAAGSRGGGHMLLDAAHYFISCLQIHAGGFITLCHCLCSLFCFFSFSEIIHCICEYALVLVAGHILHQTLAVAFGMSHLPENASVGADYALDGP